MLFSATHGPVVKPKPGVLINYARQLSEGLVGCWLFNEGSGSHVNDTSGFGNCGTIYNMSPNTQGSGWGGSKFGGGLHFDGVNDYVDCGNKSAFNLNDNITMSAWLQSKEVTDYAFVCGKKYHDNPDAVGYILYQQGGNIYATIADGTTEKNVSSSISVNGWYFVTMVLQRPTLKLYVGGVEKDSIDVSGLGTIDDNGYNFYIGRCAYSSTWGALHGSLDLVHLYNRALTAQEIETLYPAPFGNLLHVPIRYVPAAAGGLSIPVAMHHYRQQRIS